MKYFVFVVAIVFHVATASAEMNRCSQLFNLIPLPENFNVYSKAFSAKDTNGQHTVFGYGVRVQDMGSVDPYTRRPQQIASLDYTPGPILWIKRVTQDPRTEGQGVFTSMLKRAIEVSGGNVHTINGAIKLTPELLQQIWKENSWFPTTVEKIQESAQEARVAFLLSKVFKQLEILGFSELNGVVFTEGPEGPMLQYSVSRP